jgi:hypothetical protein
MEYVMGGNYKMGKHDKKCSSQNIFSITQSRRVRWDGLVAHEENMKGGIRLEDTSIEKNYSEINTIEKYLVSLWTGLGVLYNRSMFLNRRAAARYRTLASIIPGRENLSF